MIEAFEIGISLALGDGVSEGVAAARRDLQAIETAMNAGAVSVQRLREAAAGALGVAQATSARKVLKTERQAQAGEPVAGQAKAPALPAPAPSAIVNGAPLAGYAQQATPEATAARVAGTVSDAPAAPSVPKSPAVEAARPGLVLDSQAWAGGASPPGVSAGAEVRTVTILQMERQAPPIASPPPFSSGGATSGQFPPTPAKPEAPPPWPAGQPSAAVPPRFYRGAITDPPGGGWREAKAVHAPAAPVTVQQQAVPTASHGGGDRRATPAASAPAGQAREQARMEGDVFLDGALVGRWMSNYLAREAGRASAGPTGFDARRNSLMPGATVGL